MILPPSRHAGHASRFCHSRRSHSRCSSSLVVQGTPVAVSGNRLLTLSASLVSLLDPACGAQIPRSALSHFNGGATFAGTETFSGPCALQIGTSWPACLSAAWSPQ